MTSRTSPIAQPELLHDLPSLRRKNSGESFCQRARFFQVLIGVGAFCMLSGSLQAQTTIWNGSGGTGGNGTWATAGQWSNGLPAAGVTTQFSINATRTSATSVVDFTGAQSVGALQVGAGKTVTLDMADGSSLTANANGSTGINTIGTGTGPASLTLQGPGTGSATYSHIRFDVVRGSSLTLTGNIVTTGTGDSSVGRGEAVQGSSSLSVLNGANASLQTLAVGRGSSNNELLVSGANSSLTMSGTFSLGTSTPGHPNSANSARATAGGRILAPLGVIGQGVGDHSNYIEATGASSVVQFSGGLRVGDQSASPANIGGNYLRVVSGGTAKMGAALDINNYDDSSTNYGSNYVLVDSGGILTNFNNLNVRNKGLLQLASGGSIESRDLAGVAKATNLTVNSGGRFEAAGTGLGIDTELRSTVESGATFAIGLGNAVAASALSLSNTASWLQLNTGSTLEFGLFGATSGDQLQLSSANNVLRVQTGVAIKLTLQSYTPADGNTWTLLTGAATDFSTGSAANLAAATFDLPTLSGGLSWDTTNFTAAGGWEVSVIPEPSTAFLVGLSVCGFLVLRRRKRA